MLHFTVDKAVFTQLHKETSSVFKVTSQERSLIHFLNCYILQSPTCLALDQIEYILDDVVGFYCKDCQAPRFQYPLWPIYNSFGQDL